MVLGDCRLDASMAAEPCDVRPLAFGGERDDRPAGSRSCCAPGAMEVRLVLDRRISVDHEGNVIDVQTTCSDVCRHQGGGAPRLERVEVASPHGLGEVAVHFDGGHASGDELTGELAGAVLRPSEHQLATGRRCEVDDHLETLALGEVQDMVGHLSDGGVLIVDAVDHRVRQIPLDQHVDRAVKGRREEEPLAVGRGEVEKSAHRREKAEVCHVVGFVEDRDLDATEARGTRTKEILEPAGAGNDDVDTPAQGVDLGADRDAAIDRDGAQPDRGREGVDDLEDLSCQLASRSEHQRTWLSCPVHSSCSGETGDEREDECESLA